MPTVTERLWNATLGPEATPLLHDAVDGLFDLLRECDVEPRLAVGMGSPTALLRKYPSLQAMAAAGLVSRPRVDQAMAELGDAAWLHAVDDAPFDRLGPSDVVDRFLVVPVMVGLARLPAAAVREPGWLADALAALIAVEAYRPLISPQLAPEAVQDDLGCHTDPRLALLLPPGRRLAGHLGFEALVETAAGQVPWEDAIDTALLEEAALLARHASRIDWQASPAWRAGFGEQDAPWLDDAVLALCVRRRHQLATPVEVLSGQRPGAFAWSPPHAVLALPEGGGLVLDLRTCMLRTARDRPTLGRSVAEGWMDAPVSSIAVSPAACAALTESGWTGLSIALDDVDCLDEFVDVLFDLCDQGGEPQEIQGEGFRIAPTQPQPPVPMAAPH